MRQFLDALYGDLPEDAWFYIWTLGGDDKSTHWFPAETITASLDRAATLAAETTNANVYYPVGYYSERLGDNQRGTEQQIAGTIGLVADIDFRGETHPHAPHDEAAAMSFIDSLPLRPTACVNSGHGLQAIWLYKEPWHFDSDAERLQAKAFSAAWWHTLAAAASKLSYELDAVHDLTRVMRLPGTVNVKRKPVPVELRWLENDRRYNPPFDFEPHLVALPEAVKVKAEPLPTIDVTCGFPQEKFRLLCSNLPEFHRTWEHKRRMPRDNSTSGYDMALASMAVAAGWTDDEVAGLLQEHQRVRGTKPQKVADVRYFARTIQAARKGNRVEQEQFAAEQVLLDDTGTCDREKLLGSIATRLEVPLSNVQIVSGDPSIMRLWVGGKCAEVPVTSLDSPVTTYKAVLNTARYYPRPIDKKETPGWRDLVNILLRIAEEVEAGEDATAEGEFRAMLEAFLEARPPLDVPEGELVQITGNPFRRGGAVWFRILDFLQYARLHDRSVNRRQVAQRLKVIGCSQKVHKCADNGTGPRVQRFYGLPEKREEE